MNLVEIFVFSSIGLIAAILLLFRLYHLYQIGRANTERLRVERICIERTGQQPKGKVESLQVLQISDMHVEHLSISPRRLLAAVSGEQLDLIVLTGDYMDRKRSLSKFEPYLQALCSLRPKYGMFAVFGNHDYLLRDAELAKLRSMFARYGVQVLKNEHVTLTVNDQLLQLIGIDDFSTGRSCLQRSFAGLDGETAAYRLVLTHDPNVVLEMNDYSFDYLLAGHFHNGQIHWPKPYHLIKMGRLARQKRVQGLHYQNGRAFYINEGLGQTGVNLRYGSSPEISIHQLRIS